MTAIDINSDDYVILPPHFSVVNPLADIKEGVNLMYGKIITAHLDNDPSGLMIRLLASVVYHSDWILEVGNKNAGHPFLFIPILQHPDLLLRLKEKVTTNPSSIIQKILGIPPNVEQMKKQRELLNLFNEILD